MYSTLIILSQATKDESSVINDLTRELSNHEMKLSESVVEGFGVKEVDSAVDDLSDRLANKIKIITDLKNDAEKMSVGAESNNIAEDEETVEKVIEETFKDKSIAKSFGEPEAVEPENDSIVAGK